MIGAIRTAQWVYFDAAADPTPPAGVEGESLGAPRVRRLRRSSLFAGLIIGVIVALLTMALIWVFLSRDSTPLVSESDLQAARQRWNEHGPANYDIDIMLAGNRPGPVHVEVRDGVVTRMTRDGREPKQRYTWDYWTVPEMFNTIEREFEMRDDQAASAPGATGSQAELRARFDPQYGYPQRFHRTVPGRAEEVDWTVTEFTKVN